MVSLRYRECGPRLLQPASWWTPHPGQGLTLPGFRKQTPMEDSGWAASLGREGQAPALCPLGTDSVCGLNGRLFPTPVSLACCSPSWLRLWTALKRNWLWDFFLKCKTQLPGSPLFLQKPPGARIWRAGQEWVGLLCRPAWRCENFSCLCL